MVTKAPTNRLSYVEPKKPGRIPGKSSRNISVRFIAHESTVSSAIDVLVGRLHATLSPKIRSAGFVIIDPAAFDDMLNVLADAPPTQLIELVNEGVEYTLFWSLAAFLKVAETQLASLLNIPPTTFNRRKASGRFKPAESESIVRVLRCVALAVTLFDGDMDEASQWFGKPAPFLDGDTPLSRLATSFGTDQISTLLLRLEHGVYS